MAPGRSPPYGADYRESERSTQRSRGRSRSRSAGRRRSRSRHQPPDRRQSPFRKELFPNRRPPSREKEDRHYSSRDHSPPRHHRRKDDNHSPKADGEYSKRLKSSAADPSRSGSTRGYDPSRSPSPHKSKSKRRRERSVSQHRRSSVKDPKRSTGADKSWHTHEFSGDEKVVTEGSHRSSRQKSAASKRDKSPSHSTSKRQEHEKLRHSESSRRHSPSREKSHRHSTSERERRSSDHIPTKDRSKDEAAVAERESRKSTHRHHRAADRSASPPSRSYADSGRVRDRSPPSRRPRSPPSADLFSRSRDSSPPRRRHSPYHHTRLSVSPYRRGVSIERPSGKPRREPHRRQSQSPNNSQQYHQSHRNYAFGSPERHPGRFQSPSEHRYAEYSSRRSRSRSAHSARNSQIPDQPRAESPDPYDSHYARGRQHPPSHGHYAHDSRYPHHQQANYHGEYSRGGWSGYGSRGSPPARYSRHGQRSPPHHSYPPESHHGGSYMSRDPSAPSRARGGATPYSSTRPNPVGRGHFQNLTWTPDKGSRGGKAPSERLPQPGQPDDDEDPNQENDARGQDASLEESPSSIIRDESGKQTETQMGESAPGPDASDSTPSVKPIQIKFAMKAHTQPILPKRSNVIQSAPRPPRAEPSRPPLRAPPEEHRRSGFPPPGRAPPARFNKHEDWPSSKYPPDRDSRDRPFPLSKDRRYPDSRESSFVRKRDGQPPKGAASRHVRPRRKKIVKIMKTHRRTLPPPNKLSEEWAKAEFVYYPRPDKQSVVGAGTYGKVFKAHHVYLGKVVALKTLPLIKPRRKPGPREYVGRDKKRRRQERWVKDGFHLTSLREIKLLKSISHQHENVVGIREIFLEGQSCNLVFDYYEFDLHGIIYSADVLIEDAMLKDLNIQIFRGLDFLHTRANILHRDIKAANILVGTSGQVKITDFGLAKHVRDPEELDRKPWYKKKFEHSNRVITTPYRPPELLLGATVYGGEVDVWSAGCVLFESFFKKLPFQGTGEDADHLVTIWKVLGLPNVNTYPEVLDLEWYWLFKSRVKPKKSIFAKLYRNKISPQLFNLLRCIFQHDPKKRPTAAQVLTHPFFTTEEPLPVSAKAVLETVEGEWHELEYKMIRDMEKAAARRRHEDNVVIGFLEHKKREHEQRMKEGIDESDLDSAQQRVAFYESEMAEYRRRMEESRRIDKGEEEDNAKQVAEMKRTHGDMYMDAARRGRYRGPAREKADEKLLGEAWKWYEEEKKKGKDPVPTVAVPPRGRKNVSKSATDKAPKSAYQTRSMTDSAAASSLNEVSQETKSREERKRIFERKMREYEARRAEHLKRKASQLASRAHTSATEKRMAKSPLVDEPRAKKSKDYQLL